MVAISSGVTGRLRYVMIVSIPETIKHQNVERKSFLKKNCGEADNPKFDQQLPVNGYGIVYPSPERAVKALAKMHQYSEWLKESKK